MIDLARLNFTKDNGLVPCIVQDAQTLRVLMLGYMNAEAITRTLNEKRVTFFSRSKNRLWTKGETSGNYLNLVTMAIDCDGDTLLVKANPVGPVCHTGADTCFEEKNEGTSLQFLTDIIADRKKNPRKGSYTSDLFNKGINKVAQKVGEEAVELVIEAKDHNRELFLNEAADLLFHYLVLLEAKNHSLADITNILRQRHKAT